MIEKQKHNKILIILSQDHDSDHFLVFDFENLLTKNKTHISKLSKLITKYNLIIFDKAKLVLNKLNIKLEFNKKIICLKTLQKITSLNLSNNYNPEQIKKLFQNIQENNLQNLAQIECQLISVIINLEQRGLPFSKSLWQQKLKTFEHKLEDTKQELAKLFNQQDQGFALFGPSQIDFNNNQELKQNLEKLLKTNLSSTSQNTLKNFSHPAAKLLIKFREYQRMVSTYGNNFLENINNNRIHADFDPIGCSSGRISCSNPNLMALPNNHEFQICIKPPENYSLIYFDYGAFELRILAGLSQDPKLIQIFSTNKDIHSLVAQELFSQPVSKTQNSNLRAQAKLINFGIIYGMSERTLAQNLKISEHQARELLQNYFTKFSRVKDFLLALEQKARKQNYVNTILGRKLIFETKDNNFSHQLRVARNMPIQGTGADICKLAMLYVNNLLQKNNLDAGLVNMIHDELVIECHKNNLEQVKKIVSHAMQKSFSRLIPNITAKINIE